MPLILNKSMFKYMTKESKSEFGMQQEVQDSDPIQNPITKVLNILKTEANILLLTFDLTLKETYENVQKYWIKELEQYKSEESWIVLVGNKCDSKKVV